MAKIPDSVINLLNAVMVRSSVVKGHKVGKHSGSDNHQWPRIAARRNACARSHINRGGLIG